MYMVALIGATETESYDEIFAAEKSAAQMGSMPASSLVSAFAMRGDSQQLSAIDKCASGQ